MHPELKKELLDQIQVLVQEELRRALRGTNPWVRHGTIPNSYTSGLPEVIFDGEEDASGRVYPHLASYTPAADDRVALVGSGHTWLILGKITAS